MIELTQRDVVAHQQVVPWPTMRQVEQDLLLCRAMQSLFSDDFLKAQIAMRGGTLLHKVHLAPASRYSEDIDLVVIGDRPEDHIRKAINRVLKDVLGKPSTSTFEYLKLAVRNAVQPSRIIRQIYRVPSVSEPGGNHLQIVVETNVTERVPHRPVSVLPFDFPFRGTTHSSSINGFEIHEMLGTKMRALFQRRRGRDLFDLYWALKMSPNPPAPGGIVESFLHYMAQEGTAAGRDEFIEALRNHLSDPGFRSDMDPLLRTGLKYDPLEAGDYIIGNLLAHLP